MNDLLKHLKSLEEKLLLTDLSVFPETIDELLSECFEEIGHNGLVSSRSEVIDWLIHKDSKIEWQLDDFKLREITPELVLVNYREQVKNNPNLDAKGSMRSSLWQCDNDRWQMIFHQATKII